VLLAGHSGGLFGGAQTLPELGQLDSLALALRKPLRQVRLGRRQLALDAIQLVLQVLDGLRRVGQLPLGLFALLAAGA